MSVSSISVETTVLGGFPVVAEADYFPADRSTGWGRSVENICLYTKKGFPATFIERKLSKDDWDRVTEALLEAQSAGDYL